MCFLILSFSSMNLAFTFDEVAICKEPLDSYFLELEDNLNARF